MYDCRPRKFKAAPRSGSLKNLQREHSNDKRFDGNVCDNNKRNHFVKQIFVGVDIDGNSEILRYHNHVYYVEMTR